MPYKIWERHPHSVLVDPHLSVLCANGLCHPAWEDDFIRGFSSQRSTMGFKLTDVNSVHFTAGVPESMLSLDNVMKGEDRFAALGKRILVTSGHLSGSEND